jgi:DNA anti-recombination protein RmuC
MQDGLQAIVARIDERTAHIQEDVKEIKNTATELKATVIKHGEHLVSIEERIKNGNSNHHSFTKKQKAGIGGAVAGIITAIIAFLTNYFTKH